MGFMCFMGIFVTRIWESSPDENFFADQNFHPSFENDSHTALPDRRSFPQGYVKISRGHFETTVIYHIEKRADFEIAHFEKIVIYHFEGIVSLHLIIYACGNLVSRKH